MALGEGVLHVHDRVQGFARRAVLRWRLAPSDWQLERATETEAGPGHRLVNPNGHVLTVRSTAPIARCEIVQGWESLHYLEKTPVPVLELEITQPGTLTTEYHWTA